MSTNTASYGGGGVYSYGGSAKILHSTVTQNRATTTSGGGGIYLSNGLFVLDHSIVADNYIGTGSTEHNIYGALDLALSTFNLIGTGGGAGGLTHGMNGNLVDIANPGLGALGNNGGRTRTHALLLGSLAIDAGDGNITTAPSTDQRGNSRIADGDDDEVAHIDIGAFELAADEYFGSLVV